MKTNRFWEIDFLRGTAIFLVILIHCTYYFIGTSTVARFLWNYSQFCVPAFLFCAAYVYFQKDHQLFLPEQSRRSIREKYFLYLQKRFFRLLKPYYVFLIPFFLLQFFINPQILTTKYILQSFLTTGGIDISWLVLLFLQLTLLMPLFSFLFTKHKLWFYLFFSLSALSSLFFLISPTPYALNPKLVMWLPWSLVLFFTYWFIQYHDKKYRVIGMGIVSFLLFVLCSQLLTHTHHTLVLRDNKYPPNLYFLSYGILGILILYVIAPAIRFMTKPITFLSTYSYHIFFIHYFFLIWFASYQPLRQFPWWVFFGLVFGVTILTLFIINLSFRPPSRNLYKEHGSRIKSGMTESSR